MNGIVSTKLIVGRDDYLSKVVNLIGLQQATQFVCTCALQPFHFGVKDTAVTLPGKSPEIRHGLSA